jgi:hypothetical protein
MKLGKERIKDILKAYAVMLNPDEEQSMIAIHRLSVCDGCDRKKTNSVGLHYCGECGCFLKAKAFSETNTCPLNKWEK